MPSCTRFFTKAKILLPYVGTEIAAATLLITLDFVIQTDNPEFDKTLFLNRCYYLLKNLSLLSCAVLQKQTYAHHGHSALFNAGALAGIYPASQLAISESLILQNGLRGGLILGGGLALRTPLEMCHKQQNFQAYFPEQIGKWLMGFIGLAISCSGLLVAASCYWIGVLIDLTRAREPEQAWDHAWLVKYTVPMQITLVLPVKIILYAMQIKLPFSYLLDVLAAMVYLTGLLIKPVSRPLQDDEPQVPRMQ